MKIENLPRAPRQPNGSASPRALNPLVFNSFDDTPDNPRRGLGYLQLFDRTRPVTLTAKLPDVTRVGDTIKLFWDDDPEPVQTYDLDQATIDKGWLSFSVSVDVIEAPLGKVHYTLFDHEAENLQTSAEREIRVNRNVPGGLDPDTDTAINEGLTAATVSPSVIENAAIPPVTVTVPAWLHMEVGDELVVLWNGIRVSAPALTQAGVGVPQVVSIPQAVVELGGSSEKLPVNYEIRDIVDNYSLLSPTTFVDVNIDPNALPAPYLVDADPDTHVIDLALLGSNDAQIWVQTGMLAKNDIVTLTWVGRTPNSSYEETLPPQVVSLPGFEVLKFTVENAKVVAFAGGSLSAKYTVGTRVSKSANATLSGLVIPLTAPELEGAVGDVIDLGVVTGDPLIVSAPAYVGQKAGDRILLSWAGSSATGVPVIYPDEYTVQAGDEAEEVYFEVPRQNLDPLGGGTLQLSYQVVRAGGGTQISPVTTYNVTAVELVFPAPVIVQASGGVLSPMDVQAGATFQVTYTGMRTTDTIVPIWNNISDTIPWMDGKPGGDPANTVKSIVPAALIGAVIGKTIEVVYDVLRKEQGEDVGYLSDVLELSVGLIPADKLPIPQISQASGKVLDVGALQGDADLTVDAWPFIAVGQKMWMRLEGSSNLDLPDWQGYEISSPGAQATTVSKDDYLINLTDGSTLRLILEVSFDGGLTRRAFPVQSYTVIAVPDAVVPVITGVTDSDAEDIVDGGNTQDTTLNLTGTADANAQLEIMDGSTVLRAVTVNAAGAWTYQATRLSVATHIFTARYKGGSLTSDTWTVQVIPVPLTIDHTPMKLDGLYVKGAPSWPLIGQDAVGNTEIRTASGGTPPYRYSSSRPDFVSVTSTSGKAQGTGWGSSTVTVTDAVNNSASYVATSSNIYVLYVSAGGTTTHAGAVQYLQDYDLLPITQQHAQVLARLYGSPLPPGEGTPGFAWCGASAGCGSQGLLWLFPSNNFRCEPPENRYGVRGVKRK